MDKVQLESADFPFMAGVPRKEKRKLEAVWADFEEIQKLFDEHGMLLPVKLAADLGKVKHQRILQLCEAGKLVRYEIHGHPFVTQKSFLEWVSSPRTKGRPRKPDEELSRPRKES